MKQAGVSSILIALVLLAIGVIAEAQQRGKIPKIGFLEARSASALNFELFGREFRALGYVEGKSMAFEPRYADDKLDRLRPLADDLVRLKVDVIITPGNNAALAAKNA